MLSDLPAPPDERVLVDFRTADDAGVYRWGGGKALVQTVDFFTPIVDDPYVYGQIAAANALSDVYAMGGEPLTALAIAGFPRKGLGHDVIQAIFRGGFDKLREAGVSLLGGHTVQDTEVKFGYAVTGAVDPDRILSNKGARPGDVLFLTKPLGTGIVATAIKFGRAPETVIAATVRSMMTLNRSAAEALRPFSRKSVRACTDITGYGLIGHASELAAASSVTVQIASGSVPVIEGVQALVRRNRTGGGDTNKDYFGGRVKAARGLDSNIVALFYDPQTSGGLLVAVAEQDADAVARALEGAGTRAARVGKVVAAAEYLIEVQ